MVFEGLKIGDTIRVSGEVLYGDNIYRVATNAVILGIGEERSLVTLDEIDGDFNATVVVPNQIISTLS